MKIQIYTVANDFGRQISKVDDKVKVVSIALIAYFWLTQAKIKQQDAKMKLLAKEIDELKHKGE